MEFMSKSVGVWTQDETVRWLRSKLSNDVVDLLISKSPTTVSYPFITLILILIPFFLLFNLQLDGSLLVTLYSIVSSTRRSNEEKHDDIRLYLKLKAEEISEEQIDKLQESLKLLFMCKLYNL
jgi:hypothetical protein